MILLELISNLEICLRNVLFKIESLKDLILFPDTISQSKLLGSDTGICVSPLWEQSATSALSRRLE